MESIIENEVINETVGAIEDVVESVDVENVVDEVESVIKPVVQVIETTPINVGLSPKTAVLATGIGLLAGVGGAIGIGKAKKKGLVSKWAKRRLEKLGYTVIEEDDIIDIDINDEDEPVDVDSDVE